MRGRLFSGCDRQEPTKGGTPNLRLAPISRLRGLEFRVYAVRLRPRLSDRLKAELQTSDSCQTAGSV